MHLLTKYFSTLSKMKVKLFRNMISEEQQRNLEQLVLKRMKLYSAKIFNGRKNLSIRTKTKLEY